LSSRGGGQGQVEPRGADALQGAGAQFGEAAGADAQQDDARLVGHLLEALLEVAQRRGAGEGAQAQGLGVGGLDAGEAALDRGEQLLQGDGLFEELHRADAGGLDGGVDGAVAGHHHHRHGELAVGGPFLEQADAVGVGHPDVEQHEVGAGGVAGGPGGGGVFGEDDVVPLVAQDFREEFANADFVVNDENFGHGRWDSDWGAAQADADLRAAGFSVGETDLAFVFVDDLLDDGQAEPVPRALVVT
jgi:hypothetical protein